MRMDPPKNLRGRARYQWMAFAQRKWIESCERNGVSYAGKRGPAIREADEAEFRRLVRLAR